MISQRAKYALRALVMLSGVEKGVSLSITEIAAEQRIPKKFLEQILLELKRHGIVESHLTPAWARRVAARFAFPDLKELKD